MESGEFWKIRRGQKRKKLNVRTVGLLSVFNDINLTGQRNISFLSNRLRIIVLQFQ